MTTAGKNANAQLTQAVALSQNTGARLALSIAAVALTAYVMTGLMLAVSDESRPWRENLRRFLFWPKYLRKK